MTNFLQLSVSGIALGCMYALVALGFVIVLKSSGILNLLQGAFVLLGAYLTYNAHITWGLSFIPAVLIAIISCGLAGIATEAVVIRRFKAHTMEGLFAILLVTIGLLTITEAVVTSIWGPEPLALGDPWKLHSVQVARVTIAQRDVWVIGLSVIILLLFTAIFRYSKIGVAMRASASDREAALAQGISPNLIAAVSWGIAAVVGVLTGVMLATAVGGGLNNTLDQVALAAFPALILGGLESPLGAVIGGLIIGLTQEYAAGYVSTGFGNGFSDVVPYLVMIALLLVRPQGLFGEREIRRA